LASELHHPHLIRDAFSKQQERFRQLPLVTALIGKSKKSQADKPTWPFWLKLSAGGQLDDYFE
jgi:hypothetical protein